MLLINKTISLCNHCYRHIPAIVYEDNGQVLMKKNCPEHGVMDSVVEVDPVFYYSLEHKKDFTTFNQVLFEVTDRCQLSCPHCYHLPDNKVTDRPLDLVIDQVKSFPNDCMPMFAGAEATLRKDFVELCSRVNDLEFEEFSLITNGVKFADKAFTKQCFDAGLTQLCFGLNHPSYQGEKIHEKQLIGLKNLLDCGYHLGYVGYTIESLDDVEDFLAEISNIHDPKINHYRIRCGSFIGRSSDQQRSFLSNLVKKVKSILGDSASRGVYDDNPYHVMMEWGDIRLRLIQWPDVTNIDMEELATGPWCEFIDGPITNFVHQVIVRDAVKNNDLPILDLAPKKYHYRRITEEFNNDHWKHHWKGPIEFTDFDWTIDDPSMQPIPIETKTVITMKEIK
jgi:hypothetical protein